MKIEMQLSLLFILTVFDGDKIRIKASSQYTALIATIIIKHLHIVL